MQLVYARTTCVLSWSGRTIRMREDDAWDATDPLVKARPDLFHDTPQIHMTVHRSGVEEATARPGEKRTTKRV
jgi:hypothetical protein